MSNPKVTILAVPLHMKSRILDGSIESECTQCKTKVSLSPDSQKVMAAYDTEIVCPDCIHIVADGKQMDLRYTKEQDETCQREAGTSAVDFLRRFIGEDIAINELEVKEVN